MGGIRLRKPLLRETASQPGTTRCWVELQGPIESPERVAQLTAIEQQVSTQRMRRCEVRRSSEAAANRVRSLGELLQPERQLGDALRGEPRRWP